jgi:hypothetical protein
MHIKKGAFIVMAAGWISAALALDARVITMGRHDNFFMDEVSIFKNPANINIYPNMLMGDLGVYKQDPRLDSTGMYAGLAQYNRDPVRPFFGGILSYSLNQSTESGDQFPMLSIGAVFNRYDEMLDYIDPYAKMYRGGNAVMADPVGKVDVIMGCALKGGAMIGVGGYFAVQDKEDVYNNKYESKLVRGNVGVNLPITKTMDLEASVGAAYMTGIGAWYTPDSVFARDTIANGDVSVRGDVRLFSALTSLNGDFVPHFGLEVLNFKGGNVQNVNMELGVGININIDRGFFWMGVEGLFNDKDTVQQGGGRVSFGIERNIIWDWLVWRIGGSKTLMKQTGTSSNTMMIENPESDASDEDMIGFGMGVNIENRLKVDAVMSENLFYTFTNLFSGNSHHLFTRFSATYSF